MSSKFFPRRHAQQKKSLLRFSEFCKTRDFLKKCNFAFVKVITETYLKYILVKEEQLFKSTRGKELFYKLKLKIKL